jgi:2-polyprenyl-6-methoxyphenol hydroxylase-like FAD-dependent oxidoreductase
MRSTFIGRQAVVIGASMAGLAAAGALANLFERVVVLERDTLPSDAAHRAGTPQSRHLHALLGGGQRALGELFPAFEQELAAAGAQPLRVNLDIRGEFPGIAIPQRDLGIVNYSMSRPLIEALVRRRVRDCASVSLRDGCRVLGLAASADGETVTGVRYENTAGGAEGQVETVPADLVVDASGRGIITLGFLDQVGAARPDEAVIGVDIGYATLIFAIPDDAPSDWKALLTMPQANESSRGVLMMPIEGQRWLATIAGRYHEKPPGDAVGFLQFAQQLRTPTFFDAVRGAQRLTEVVRFGFPQSVWRHYERLARFPRGLLPFGDAICRFNPIWGQGMTVAAQEALLLRRLLGADDGGDPLAGLAPAFFAEAAKLIETPWSQAAIPDFALPQTSGDRPPDFERRVKFGGALQRLAVDDPAVHKLTMEVRHLLKPASALREPELVARVQALMAEA